MLLLASAGLGALQGAQASKQRKEENAFRREAIRYSPWTQMGDPGASQVQGNTLTGGIQGGLTGAMLGQMMGTRGAENMFGKTGLASQAEEQAVEADALQKAGAEDSINKARDIEKMQERSNVAMNPNLMKFLMLQQMQNRGYMG
jgi:hypothetical protein